MKRYKCRHCYETIRIEPDGERWMLVAQTEWVNKYTCERNPNGIDHNPR